MDGGFTIASAAAPPHPGISGTQVPEGASDGGFLEALNRNLTPLAPAAESILTPAPSAASALATAPLQALVPATAPSLGPPITAPSPTMMVSLTVMAPKESPSAVPTASQTEPSDKTLPVPSAARVEAAAAPPRPAAIMPKAMAAPEIPSPAQPGQQLPAAPPGLQSAPIARSSSPESPISLASPPQAPPPAAPGQAVAEEAPALAIVSHPSLVTPPSKKVSLGPTDATAAAVPVSPPEAAIPAAALIELEALPPIAATSPDSPAVEDAAAASEAVAGEPPDLVADLAAWPVPPPNLPPFASLPALGGPPSSPNAAPPAPPTAGPQPVAAAQALTAEMQPIPPEAFKALQADLPPRPESAAAHPAPARASLPAVPPNREAAAPLAFTPEPLGTLPETGAAELLPLEGAASAELPHNQGHASGIEPRPAAPIPPPAPPLAAASANPGLPWALEPLAPVASRPADGSAPSPSPPPLPMRQVAPIAIALAFTPGVANGFQLALDPAELGRVEIRVQREGESHSVRVTAERPETLALLLRDRQELDRSLSDAGLRVEAKGIEFTLSPQSGGTDQRSQGEARAAQPRAGRPRSSATNETDTPPPARAQRGLLDLNI